MDVIPEVIENADSIADQVQKDNLLSALVMRIKELWKQEGGDR